MCFSNKCCRKQISKATTTLVMCAYMDGHVFQRVKLIMFEDLCTSLECMFFNYPVYQGRYAFALA